MCRPSNLNDRIFSSKRPHVSPQTSARFSPNTAMYFRGRFILSSSYHCAGRKPTTAQHPQSLTSHLLPLTFYPICCSIVQLPPATATAIAHPQTEAAHVLEDAHSAPLTSTYSSRHSRPSCIHSPPLTHRPFVPSSPRPLVPLNSSLAPLTPYLLPQPGYLPALSPAFRFPSANSRMFVE